MSFEKSVLAKVATIVGTNDARFFCGTLFVRCSAKEAVKIESKLLENANFGVILSRIGDESAFDFV
jgi:hypothetical protein